MINMVGVEYVLPPPPPKPDIPAVASAMKYRGYRRNKDREKEESKKKRRSIYDMMLTEKEEGEEPGQLGCFFEARA
ncbi:MAG: hypothetical protein K6F34_03545 [Lachnospiraceae bacterium]|nr:hypothetical protein [Lachnospiraceae bacterium]